MITLYESGQEFLEANRDYLNTRPYASVFFFADAPLLTHADKINYAMRVTQGEKMLLALKTEPYNLLLFGAPECVPELAACLFGNSYNVKNFHGEERVGDRMAKVLWDNYGLVYTEALAMDFLEAREVTEPSSEEVEPAVPEDLNEICTLMERFVIDCGLLDKVSREKTEETITRFRVLRRNGQIASIAKGVPSGGPDVRITNVYTRNEYRGRGLARKVVNTLKNEILASGKTATLNVDKKNPISYHIYQELGFKKKFSQGEYRKVL